MFVFVRHECAFEPRRRAVVTRRMRILHVVPSYLPAVRYGGPIVTVHGLCRALAARGHRVEVFTTNIDGDDDSPVPLGIPVLLEGVYVTYYPSKTLRRLFWSPPLARALNTQIDTFSVLHLHSVFLWPTWVAARAARRLHVPYLISPRGMLVEALIRRRSRIAKSLWIEFIERKNLEKASAIHVTSGVEADELRRFAWRLPRIETIPNGVEEPISYSLSQVSADVQEITANQPMVLFLGRLSWKKGLDRLLNAFALTSLPRLAIVGPDDEGLLPKLEVQARELQIADRVRFLPRSVLGADKEHLYASARVFVLPSYSENFGNTVLEAMHRGLPVVVTPEVGAADIVLAANAGLVVRGDAKPLSMAISELAESAALARSMGEAGRRHVNAHYGWAQIAAQMEELYASLAPSPAAAEARDQCLEMGR
jgi:glycosyltransferase involved in cell wall biosynthesis